VSMTASAPVCSLSFRTIYLVSCTFIHAAAAAELFFIIRLVDVAGHSSHIVSFTELARFRTVATIQQEILYSRLQSQIFRITSF